MPDDSNGNYSLPNGYLAVTGEKVLPSNHNPPLEDIAAALTARYSRDGRAPMLGNVPMGGFLVTGMGAGVADADAVTKKQLGDGLSDIATDLGGAITLNAEKIATKSADYQAVKADNSTSFRFTAVATLSFIQADDSDPDVPGLGANWHCEVWAVGGAVTLDPNASETINGTATLIVQQGQKATIFCTGSAFFAVITSDALSGPQLQGYTYGLALTTNASDAANDVDIAAGAAASDASPYDLMQFSAMTKRLDAVWSAGNNGGMLDTGTVADGTYYFYGIQRSDTLATDFIASLSASGPLMPTNYDRKRRIGMLIRASGVNGTPVKDGSPNINVSPLVPTTSGAAINFVGIPPGVRRITVVTDGVSGSDAALIQIQLGTASGIETTGYIATTNTSGSTTGFPVGGANASSWSRGQTVLTRIDTNTWVAGGSNQVNNSSAQAIGGSKTLSGELTQLRLSGPAAFDAGQARILWEY